MFDAHPDDTDIPADIAMTILSKPEENLAPARPPSADKTLNLASWSMREEMMDRETEKNLARAWHERKDYAARDRLILSHMRIASKSAHRMKRSQESVNDLIQEGVKGLMKAVDMFDPERGIRFSTYARAWVNSVIQEAVMSTNGAVRYKSSAPNRAAFHSMSKILRKAESSLRRQGQNPSDYDIRCEAARMQGRTIEAFEKAMTLMPKSVSLNQPAERGENGPENSAREKIDVLPCENPNAEKFVIQESSAAAATNAIAMAMQALSEREIKIIRARKMSNEAVTLADLSVELNISRERVRQLEVRALEKMRTHLERAGITGLEFLVGED